MRRGSLALRPPCPRRPAPLPIDHSGRFVASSHASGRVGPRTVQSRVVGQFELPVGPSPASMIRRALARRSGNVTQDAFAFAKLLGPRGNGGCSRRSGVRVRPIGPVSTGASWSGCLGGLRRRRPRRLAGLRRGHTCSTRLVCGKRAHPWVHHGEGRRGMALVLGRLGSVRRRHHCHGGGGLQARSPRVSQAHNARAVRGVARPDQPGGYARYGRAGLGRRRRRLTQSRSSSPPPARTCPSRTGIASTASSQRAPATRSPSTP